LWHNSYGLIFNKLKVPPKVKNLVWKVCHDCFPTRVRSTVEVLHVLLNVLCAVMLARILYMLFLLVLEHPKFDKLRTYGMLQIMSWMSIIIRHQLYCVLLDQLQPSQRSLFTSVFYSIWKCRNLRLWQQVNETTTQVFERAVHLLEDLKLAQELKQPAGTLTPNMPPGPRY